MCPSSLTRGCAPTHQGSSAQVSVVDLPERVEIGNCVLPMPTDLHEELIADRGLSQIADETAAWCAGHVRKTGAAARGSR